MTLPTVSEGLPPATACLTGCPQQLAARCHPLHTDSNVADVWVGVSLLTCLQAACSWPFCATPCTQKSKWPLSCWWAHPVRACLQLAALCQPLHTKVDVVTVLLMGFTHPVSDCLQATCSSWLPCATQRAKTSMPPQFCGSCLAAGGRAE